MNSLLSIKVMYIALLNFFYIYIHGLNSISTQNNIRNWSEYSKFIFSQIQTLDMNPKKSSG